MVKFLIERPIAVIMTFIAILILGIAAMNGIPVSLMPDIDIPEITVQISSKNTSAREMENTVIKPIRRQLMQISHLDDITSETRNGSSTIQLKLEYGTDVDFAFIEANEKIDQAMSYLPNNIERPRVIKASATDIPVIYLNLTMKENNQDTEANKTDRTSQKFVELSRFASQVIRKRIEQLPEVALVDISGTINSELLIVPNNSKLESLGVTLAELENTIKQNNIQLGNLLIRDGQYQYNVRFSSTIRNKHDIENIYIKHKGRLIQIKELAEVIEHPQKQKGKVVSDGKDAISMAVIKQSDAQIAKLKDKLNSLVQTFENDYPEIQFTITRNQTKLLDYSLENLRQSLIIGAILAFFIMFFFLKDFRSPLLIGISIPVSLIISMLFFYVLKISINIISLSGIILGVGMMIDNSIIVIDNISQYKDRLWKFKTNKSSQLKDQLLITACADSTNEVFRPMLSSVLTTCAVFIPLIFIRGISGALFYDQAIAITIGLFVSLAVSVTLLPVLYRLMYKNQKKGTNKILSKLNKIDYPKIYEKGFRFIMKRQPYAWLLTALFLLFSILLYHDLDKTKLPPIEKDEIMLHIDWNEHIHINENARRVQELTDHLGRLIIQNTSMIGEQQFIMNKNNSSSSSESVIYLKAKNNQALDSIIRYSDIFLKNRYPSSRFEYKDAGNIFNLIFSDNEMPLTARLRATKDINSDNINSLYAILSKIRKGFPEHTISTVPIEEYTILHTNTEKLLLYNIEMESLYNKLKSAFNENQLFLITDNQDFVPVIIGNKTENINSILYNLYIENKNNERIPVKSLISESKGEDLKTILAGQEGEYFPVDFDVPKEKALGVMDKLRTIIQQDKTYEISFKGSILSNQKLLREIVLILVVSLALLYFILASQFESLSLPLIVLLEVPVDIFGALLALKLGGAGINLMSLIGIIVMSGIIINDSILKIDTINQLRSQGYSLIRALIEAGHRRLKPILMTSLTTILALVPFLFTSGLGSDLQRPLALAVIGGMSIGTLVSLYLVPLCYYYLKRK